MAQSEKIQKFDLIVPAEENGYCIFQKELEENPLVFFHLTPSRNFNSIVLKGFLSAKELGIGDLTSVAYAKRSSSCFANKGNIATEDLIVFAVKFNNLNQKGIKDNPSDIFVYLKEVQPTILGYCDIHKGYRLH